MNDYLKKFNCLKKFSLYQYASLIAGVLLFIGCFGIFENYRHHAVFLPMIAVRILEIGFCAIVFFKGFDTKFGIKALSVILILFSVNCVYEMIASSRLAFSELLLLVYYVSSVLIINRKINYNFVTFVSGILLLVVALMEMSRYHSETVGVLLFDFLVFWIVYEVAEKRKAYIQGKVSEGTEKLKDLVQLLDENYITREEYDVMKGYIIGACKEADLPEEIPNM